MELVIESLEDVLPHIVPDTGIIHSVHDGYSVVNYIYSLETTFDSDVARECRGLKFGPDGKLIARPFHKFFNLGEKRLPQDEPWDQSHVVLDKLDGSMIHPAIVKGEMVFMTRMGVTDHGRTALSLASDGVKSLAKDMLASGYTAIFEYTGPKNRIVVPYEVPELTLLAIRETRSGCYMSMSEITKVAAQHDVPVVKTFAPVADVGQFLRDTRALEGIEGYVIAFEDGHRLKIKTDLYALQHKALADLGQEKNLIGLIARDALDDILPLLAPDIADSVQTYRDHVLGRIAQLDGEISAFVEANRSLERRDFAAKVKAEVNPQLQSVAFRALDGTQPRLGLIEILERASGSETKVDAIRPMFGMEWTPPHS